MPSLPRKILVAIRDRLTAPASARGYIGVAGDAEIEAIDRALDAGSRGKRMRRDRRTEKISTYRAGREEIRIAVVARAAGYCESCHAPLAIGEGDLDEIFGGSGRRRQMMAVETCWLLHRSCHRERTENHPTRVYWDLKIILWARNHGYRKTEELIYHRIPTGDLP